MELDKLKSLVSQFSSQVKQVETEKPTIFQISGYPHYENVASNILQFFFSPDEVHGMKELFLSSLFNLLGEDLTDWDDVTVEREYMTGKSNRIDLVIDSGSFVIAIENKIFASENNDFDDYRKYILRKHKGKKCYFVKLGLVQGAQIYGWENITYENFFNKVFENIGQYLPGVDIVYLNYLLDFSRNFEYLRRRTKMDSNLLTFMQENKDTINDLYEQLVNLREDFRSKVQNMKNDIESDESYSSLQFKSIKCWLWRTSHSLADVLVFDLVVNDSVEPIAIDLTITLAGWECQIFYRKNSSKWQSIAELRQWLMEREIPLCEGYIGNRVPLFKDIPYSEDDKAKQNILDCLRLLSEG